MKSYLLSYAFVVGLICSLNAGFNVLVDPYGIWHDLRAIGFNDLKPARGANQRLSEVGAWARNPTSNIILGTSRGDIGLDPSHSAFDGATYNLAMVGQSLAESTLLLEWAASREPLNQVVFAADFFTANMNWNQNAITVEGNLRDPTAVLALFSFDATLDSIRTIRQSQQGKLDDGLLLLDEHGFQVKKTHGFYPHRKAFLASEKSFIETTYLPRPLYKFAFSANGKSAEALYRRIFKLSYRQNVGLNVLISPSHARQWEVVDALGLWPLFEDWKEMLTRVNDEEALIAGKSVFPIWDFSGFSEITTESVPTLENTATSMKWYWESSHYKKEAGDLVLSKVLGNSGQIKMGPNDFGTLIDSKNIKMHLYQLRKDLNNWKSTHNEDVGEIQNIIYLNLNGRKVNSTGERASKSPK